MNFREMSKVMTEDEIETVFRIVLPYGKMLDFERHTNTNYISVNYTLPEDRQNIHELNLLPDDVYFKCENVGKEKLLENGDILHRYRKFNVARGYSEIWLNNPFANK